LRGFWTSPTKIIDNYILLVRKRIWNQSPGIIFADLCSVFQSWAVGKQGGPDRSKNDPPEPCATSTKAPAGGWLDGIADLSVLESNRAGAQLELHNPNLGCATGVFEIKAAGLYEFIGSHLYIWDPIENCFWFGRLWAGFRPNSGPRPLPTAPA
jgi:hypothetical protein